MIDSAAAEAAIAMPPEPDGRPPVLLVHGTDSATDESWSTTYVPALTAAGFAVFTINLPDRALADIQVSAEYVVYAVRRIAGMTGRKLAIIGHSQGGLEPRWALRWWPDLRDQVSDVISLGTPQHGTVSADLNCAVGCAAAVWQMTQGSQLLAALNRDVETPGTAGYTSIYSATDELVQPQIPQSTSALDGAANILVQDLCPGRPVNHVGLMRDAVVYALALDALTHDGPADASRIPITVCAQVIIPGVDPVAQFDAEMDFLISFTRDSSAFNTDSEPPLRDYAQAGGS
ncbi:MAG: esterase/lipase family protein [Nevskiales bacterium]